MHVHVIPFILVITSIYPLGVGQYGSEGLCSHQIKTPASNGLLRLVQWVWSGLLNHIPLARNVGGARH